MKASSWVVILEEQWWIWLLILHFTSLLSEFVSFTRTSLPSESPSSSTQPSQSPTTECPKITSSRYQFNDSNELRSTVVQYISQGCRTYGSCSAITQYGEVSCLRFLFYTRYFSLFSKSHIPIQIANWDVSRVTHFNGLFKESQFNEPLCNWDTGMSSYEQTVLTPSNYTLRHIYPGSVTSMHSMFFDNEAFNQPLSHFNTSNVVDVRFLCPVQPNCT